MTSLRSSLLVASVLLFSACGSPFSDAPPVADSTFASVLAELHLAEARLQVEQFTELRRRQGSDSLRIPVPPVVRDSILARHGLTTRQFQGALEYYIRHPGRYKDVYVQVVDTLNAERQALRLEDDRSSTPPRERSIPRVSRGE